MLCGFFASSPGFTLVAVLTLSLGIGANTAIFQLIDSIRLRTIPVKSPQELGTIRIADRHWGSGQFSSQYSQLTFAMWEQIRKRQEGFAEIAVWSDQRFNLATGGEVRKAKGIRVSGDFFHVLGVEPILGRLLGPADDQPGCGISGASISYAFWQRNFDGDPSVIGKRLALDGNSFQVIGVTPPGFNGISIGDTFDVAVPICVEPILSPRNNRLTRRHAWWLAAIGRLKPGWTMTRANAQVLAVTPAILQETIPTVYDAEATKKYLEYKLGAFSRQHRIFGVALGFRDFPVVAPGNLRTGLAHRLCQPRELDARARQCARAANHHPPCPRSLTMANGSRIALGKPVARSSRVDLRTVFGFRDKPHACGCH